MGGNNNNTNNANDDPTKLTPDQPCSGCCRTCTCNCGCAACFSRLDNVADESNREQYGNEGGIKCMPTMPISILTKQFSAVGLTEASYDASVTGPNEAPMLAGAGASYALTHANLDQHIHSHHHKDSYQEEWLRQDRMLVDDNPGAFFVSPPSPPDRIDTPMLEDELFFGQMEIDGSMAVGDGNGNVADSHSTISQMTSSRTHTSRSASQVLLGLGNFVGNPLPLLPEEADL